MASSVPLLLFIVLMISIPSSSSSSAFGVLGERRVGGRTEVRGVESNREIQDLGRFCVKQYNRKIRSPSSPLLSFSGVVFAERQVVSGIKYYLRIAASRNPTAAASGPRSHMMYFDAVVVVKPWLQAKDLVYFAPSAAGYLKEALSR